MTAEANLSPLFNLPCTPVGAAPSSNDTRDARSCLIATTPLGQPPFTPPQEVAMTRKTRHFLDLPSF